MLYKYIVQRTHNTLVVNLVVVNLVKKSVLCIHDQLSNAISPKKKEQIKHVQDIAVYHST